MHHSNFKPASLLKCMYVVDFTELIEKGKSIHNNISLSTVDTILIPSLLKL